MAKFTIKTLIVVIILSIAAHVVCLNSFPTQKYYFKSVGYYIAVCNKVTGEIDLVLLRGLK